jgi:hypothetical protein
MSEYSGFILVNRNTLGPINFCRKEIFSSSNPEDAPKALTIAGWSPETSDKNPTLTIQLPKESPIIKITSMKRLR